MSTTVSLETIGHVPKALLHDHLDGGQELVRVAEQLLHRQAAAAGLGGYDARPQLDDAQWRTLIETG